ncbi:MAG: helix-turn-helix transcriptional regulator [Roseivirga sp.]
MMANKNDEKLTAVQSSGNVFADIGIANAERHLAKVELAHQINRIIEQRGLKQAEAAELLAINQLRVSALSCGHLAGFSTEKLISFLNKLDHDVEIIVKKRPTHYNTQGRLKVALG